MEPPSRKVSEVLCRACSSGCAVLEGPPPPLIYSSCSGPTLLVIHRRICDSTHVADAFITSPLVDLFQYNYCYHLSVLPLFFLLVSLSLSLPHDQPWRLQELTKRTWAGTTRSYRIRHSCLRPTARIWTTTMFCTNSKWATRLQMRQRPRAFCGRSIGAYFRSCGLCISCNTWTRTASIMYVFLLRQSRESCDRRSLHVESSRQCQRAIADFSFLRCRLVLLVSERISALLNSNTRGWDRSSTLDT